MKDDKCIYFDWFIDAFPDLEAFVISLLKLVGVECQLQLQAFSKYQPHIGNVIIQELGCRRVHVIGRKAKHLHMEMKGGWKEGDNWLAMDHFLLYCDVFVDSHYLYLKWDTFACASELKKFGTLNHSWNRLWAVLIFETDLTL